MEKLGGISCMTRPHASFKYKWPIADKEEWVARMLVREGGKMSKKPMQ